MSSVRSNASSRNHNLSPVRGTDTSILVWGWSSPTAYSNQKTRYPSPTLRGPGDSLELPSSTLEFFVQQSSSLIWPRHNSGKSTRETSHHHRPLLQGFLSSVLGNNHGVGACVCALFLSTLSRPWVAFVPSKRNRARSPRCSPDFISNFLKGQLSRQQYGTRGLEVWKEARESDTGADSLSNLPPTQDPVRQYKAHL